MPSELLDQQLLSELESVLADDFNLLLDTFFVDSEQRFKALHQLVAQRSWPDVRSMAHSFKGSASNLGVQVLADVCSRLELASRDHQLQLIDGLMQELDQAYASSMRALKLLYPTR